MLTGVISGMLIGTRPTSVLAIVMESFLAITLIILGILLGLIGFKRDLESCRNDRDRAVLGKFLFAIVGLGVLIVLCNQWLPSTLVWLAWIALLIGITLLVIWIQNSRIQPDKSESGSPSV